MRLASHKLALYFAIASVALLAVGVCGAWYVHVLQGRVAWALADNVTSIRASIRLQGSLAELGHAVDRFRETGHPDALSRPPNAVAEVRRWADEVTRYASTDYEFGLMRDMNTALDKYLSQLPPNVAARPSTEIDNHLLTTIVAPTLQKYLDFNEAELADRSRDNQAMASWLVVALAFAGIGGCAAGAASGYGLARGIRRTVYQLSIPLKDVAGRLNQVVGPVEIADNPAMDDLEPTLRKIAAEVRSIIEKFEATHRQAMRREQLAGLGQLAAGLAHELHNPLMSIKILVQSARADDQPLQGEDLRVLDEEIARLGELLQGFLNFARPPRLEWRTLDLRRTVSDTVTILAARAARRKITIKCSLPKRPVTLSGDEAQLRQVVLNLLLNALDAVPDRGAIWIDLGVGRDELAGARPFRYSAQTVFLAVTDNGRGLVAADPQRIFEPFYSTKETGLGLGLAICQRIVESHGGTIQATARRVGGVKFLVTLPAGGSQAETPSAERHSLPHAEPALVDAPGVV